MNVSLIKELYLHCKREKFRLSIESYKINAKCLNWHELSYRCIRTFYIGNISKERKVNLSDSAIIINENNL
jgi:hypothetical protein